MQKSPVIALFAAIFILAVTAGACKAANRPFAVTLSPFAGLYQFDDDQLLEDSPVYGLAVGYNIRERWGIEGAFSVIDAEYKPNNKYDADIYNFTLNALYHYRPNRTLVPFITAGIGVQSIHPGGGDSDENLLFNYGAGLKYFLTENIAVRAEARHLLVHGSLGQESEIVNNLTYTIGMTFQLGGNRRNLPKQDTWDGDGDGVPDKFDRCAGTPSEEQVDGFGCH